MNILPFLVVGGGVCTEFVEALFKVTNILRDVESHKLEFAPIDQRTISSRRDLQGLLKVIPSEPTKKTY